MSDLVGNPEDRFSRVAARFITTNGPWNSYVETFYSPFVTFNNATALHIGIIKGFHNLVIDLFKAIPTD